MRRIKDVLHLKLSNARVRPSDAPGFALEQKGGVGALHSETDDVDFAPYFGTTPPASSTGNAMPSVRSCSHPSSRGQVSDDLFRCESSEHHGVTNGRTGEIIPTR